MTKNNAVIPDKIDIVDFTIQNATLKSEFGLNDSTVDSHTLNVGYDTQFNLKDKLIKAVIKIDVVAKKDGEEVGQGNFEMIFIYHVENLDSLAKEEDNKLIVNGGLSSSLASITYSTSRGILMTRFQGTVLRNFILPVINPNDLLKKS
ncbi:MAG TPA: hypothetical protein VKY37_02700 [Brumimicrobium sp.]|nr:hypothetical protein [Brumimicrobium sp.]